jgi:hypothetical protein
LTLPSKDSSAILRSHSRSLISALGIGPSAILSDVS